MSEKLIDLMERQRYEIAEALGMPRMSGQAAVLASISGHRGALADAQAEVEMQEIYSKSLAAELEASRSALEAVKAENERLREALHALLEWSDAMPDAEFTTASPRWAWWHRRPAEQARSALLPSSLNTDRSHS